MTTWLSEQELEQALAETMLSDRFRLRRQAQQLRQSARSKSTSSRQSAPAHRRGKGGPDSPRSNAATSAPIDRPQPREAPPAANAATSVENADRPEDGRFRAWQSALERSQAQYRQRRGLVPRIEYDEALPVVQQRDHLRQMIADHQVVVVCGETGSGKSTQLPKICLELGRGVAGMIGHTQPRRIAARSVAGRIAEELRVPAGDAVGFQVRFNDTTTPRTLIKLMTDGVLLAETQSDPWLNRYDTLIIDEAHERSLNIDFLLGYLRQRLDRRPELKLIITSATIDAERFAAHFQTPTRPVPVIEVSGRTYPVEVLYRPLDEDDSETKSEAGSAGRRSDARRGSPGGNRGDQDRGRGRDDQEVDLFAGITRAVGELCDRGPGDILVFLPTERDIHEAIKLLKGQSFGGSRPELLPLYARLTEADQQRVFQRSGSRRVILSTNVAESSLTVPGIRYVIDTGTVRLSRYSPRSKMQRLPIEPISQASANQRAGRCGRVGPGVCIRLYREEDFRSREAFTPPEIQRSNLAAVILQTLTLGLGDLEQFPFLDPPKSEAIRDGYQTLFELRAVTEQRQITELGRQLGQLPVDPRIARMILASLDEHCLPEMLVIAAALEVQDPRERPLERQQAADEAHAQFRDLDSDFVEWLKIWDFYHHLKGTVTRSQLRKACQQNFLSYPRMREWLDVHRELVELTRDLRHRRQPPRTPTGNAPSPTGTKTAVANITASAAAAGGRSATFVPLTPAKSAALHRALLTGLLSMVAMRKETGEFLAAGNQLTWLWPGSGLQSKPPKWCLAAELLETSRRFLRTVARIDPQWIEPLAEHLIVRTYSEPHWSPESLAVLAYEKVTLFGLPVVPRRTVRYARIDRPLARQLFLQRGLVEGEWPEPPEFLATNLQLIKTLEERQARARQPNLLRDHDARYDFYDARLPADVVDGQQLVHALKREPLLAKLLLMTEADLLIEASQFHDPQLFPDHLPHCPLRLPLSYAHDPGGAADGVTISVPQAALNQLSAEQLEWLVPGLLEEKVVALLRSLPKDARRSLVPIPETGARLTQELQFGQGPLRRALVDALAAVIRVQVAPEDFAAERLPDHLRMRIIVLGEKDEPLATSRDLEQLRMDLGSAAATTFADTTDSRWTRDGLTAWDFGPLPREVPVQRAGVSLVGYPTLLDQSQAVGLRLYDSRERAEYELRHGLRRLFALSLARPLKQLVDHLPHLNGWVVGSQAFPQPFPLRDQLPLLIVDRACLADDQWPRTAEQFAARAAEGREALGAAASEVTRVLQPLFESFTQVRKLWAKATVPQWQATRADIHGQLAELLAPGFLLRTPWVWLTHYPRYLKAIGRRIEKLTGGGHVRDQQQLPKLLPRWQRTLDRSRLHQQRQLYDPALELHRWMVEEFRVLLFAQELGVAVTVSEKRLDKQWESVRS